MTVIDAQTHRIDLAKLQKLDVSGKDIRQLTEAEKAEFRTIQEMAYTRPVNLENHPSQKLYAEVIVNGQSVAKLYNSGAMETSNAMYGRISKLPSVKDPQGTGPVLAQERAEELARALGGKVVSSSTALTAAEWGKVPPVEFKVDYEAMERDRKAILERGETARTNFTTQVIAQSDSTELEESPAEEKSVVDEFLEFAEKSYEEKMYDLILRRLGLTEEDLKAMTPEQRAEIEEKIRAMVKAEIEKETGVMVAAA